MHVIALIPLALAWKRVASVQSKMGEEMTTILLKMSLFQYD